MSREVGVGEIRELPVELTQEELDIFSHELAKLITLRSTLEAEKKALVAGYTERLKKIQMETREIATKITSGMEEREVACRVVCDYAQGTRCLVRQDTGEMVEERELTIAERQLALPLELPEMPAAEDELADPPAQGEKKESDFELPMVDGMNFKHLQSWGWSRDEAKLLTRGFRLVRLDRDMKRIDYSHPNLRLYWLPDTVRETFSAAERDLKQAVEGPEQFVAVGMDGGASRCPRVTDAGFTFYRVEGLSGHHAQCRIKIGPQWTTWKKFDSPEECQAAWDDLMNNDPMALEG